MRAKLWIHLCESTRELTWVGQGKAVQLVPCAGVELRGVVR